MESRYPHGMHALVRDCGMLVAGLGWMDGDLGGELALFLGLKVMSVDLILCNCRPVKQLHV